MEIQNFIAILWEIFRGFVIYKFLKNQSQGTACVPFPAVLVFLKSCQKLGKTLRIVRAYADRVMYNHSQL